MTRTERIEAIAANGLSPIRTRAALEATSELELTGLEKHLVALEAREPYAAATKSAPRTAQASDDPLAWADGDVYRNPPNGYAIGLAAKGVALRRVIERPNAPKPVIARVMANDPYRNPPDGYALALKKENRR
jgi:hypothetical protein